MSIVLSGETSDGYQWSVSAESESAQELMTMLTIEKDGRRRTAGFGGPPLHGNDPINSWTGTRDGMPTFVMLRAAATVQAADAIDMQGFPHEIALSPVHPEFGLRFGVLRVPDGVEVVALRPRLKNDRPPAHTQPLRRPARPTSRSGWAPDQSG